MPNNTVYLYISKMAIRNQLGKNAENQAVNYLHSNGYVVLNRNYRFEKAEIDIIAQKNNLIAFVEVKYRKNDSHGFPEDFVSDSQKRRISDAAEEWIYENNWNGEIRFDIISITKNNGLEHLEDAFYLEDEE